MSDTPRLHLPTMPHAAPETTSAEANGSVQPTAIPRRRGDARGGMVADRTPWLDLPRPYDNLEFRAYLDYPKSVDDLRTPPAPRPDGTPMETPEEQNDRLVFFCQQVILDHREACTHGGDPDLCDQHHGPWLDRSGEPMPSPETREFWDQLSTPLGGAIMTRFWEELRDTPKFSASRQKRRKNWKRR